MHLIKQAFLHCQEQKVKVINAKYVSRLLIDGQNAITCKAMNIASVEKQHKCNQPTVSYSRPTKADRIFFMRLYNVVSVVNIAEGLQSEPFPFT